MKVADRLDVPGAMGEVPGRSGNRPVVLGRLPVVRDASAGRLGAYHTKGVGPCFDAAT
jgi:hypothetical protein